MEEQSLQRDFRVRWVDDPEQLTGIIFHRLFFENRLVQNKPCILLLTGESGDGKTTTAFSLLDNHYKRKGLDLVKILPYILIFNPGQFYNTINLIISPPKDHPDYELLKEIDTLLVDEASEVVSSAHWQTSVNENIRRINAISRGVKPLFMIWISPFSRDIELKTRTTLNYHGICSRKSNAPTRLRLRKIIKDEQDFEKPKIIARNVSGYITMPNGQTILDYPQFEFLMPRKEIMDIYKVLEKENKIVLIEDKLAKLADWFKKETYGNLDRIKAIIDHYADNPDQLGAIAEKKRNKWKVKPMVQYMYNLNRHETLDLEKRLSKQLTEKGVFDNALSESTA